MDACTSHRTGLGLALCHHGAHLVVVSSPHLTCLWWPMFMVGHPHKAVLDGLEFA